MAKGIVIDGCENILLENNKTYGYDGENDIAIGVSNSKNINLKDNLNYKTFTDKEIINIIDEANKKNDKFPKDIPLEYVKELLNTRNANSLSLWLEKNGFNPAWVIASILSIAGIFL